MNGEKMPEVQFKILCLLLNEGCNTWQAVAMLKKIIEKLEQDKK